MMINEKVLRELGSRVRRERKRNELTQEKLAEQAGISTSALSAIENGKAQPKLLTLALMAQALNVTMDFLVMGHHSKQTEFSSIDRMASRLDAIQYGNLEQIVHFYCLTCEVQTKKN